MTRKKFLDRLKKLLRRLPAEAAEDALSYYAQYFDDAGPEKEQEALAQLGSPEQVASAILADQAVKQMEAAPKSTQKWFGSLGLILSAILCAPVALPLAVVAVCLIMVMVIVLLLLFFCVYLIDLSLLVIGVILLVSGVGLLGQSAASAALFAGLGLLSIGASVALFIPTTWLTKKCASGIVHGIQRKLVGRNQNEK